MEIVKFEAKWFKSLEELLSAIGRAQQELYGVINSENYLRESHLLAVENEKVVASAFLMQFDRYYLTLWYLPEYINAVSGLFKEICIYASKSSLKELCCCLHSHEKITKKLIEDLQFCNAGKYFRMQLLITQAHTMPENVRVLEPWEIENGSNVILDAFDEITDRKMVEKTLQEALDNNESVFLGCFEGVALSGCILILLYPTDKTKAYIPAIAVRQASQGKGHGKKLLDGARAWACASGVKELTLSVRAENTRAIRLYTSAGFNVVDEVEIYCYQFI